MTDIAILDLAILDLYDRLADLDWNGYNAVLLRYEDGQQALWVTDEYLAGEVDDSLSPQRFTLNDINSGVTIEPGEDIHDLVLAWQRAVEWEG